MFALNRQYHTAEPTLRIFGVFHPLFSNLKLKTHLREHSRQSPVPKIRSCFLSEFSGIGRTCFFFFLWFNEKIKLFSFTQYIRLIQFYIFKQYHKSKFEKEFTQIICLTQIKYSPADAYPPKFEIDFIISTKHSSYANEISENH